MAGLWERWRDPASGEPLESCCIVTTSPAAAVAQVHDRMPVILPPTTWSLWLDDAPSGTPCTDLFLAFPAAQMEAFPVSKRVNSPANEGPENIVPVQLAETAAEN